MNAGEEVSMRDEDESSADDDESYDGSQPAPDEEDVSMHDEDYELEEGILDGRLDPRKISVEDLRGLIEEHTEEGTLGRLLTEICSDESDEMRCHVDRSSCRSIWKTFGTPLSFACMDPDGERGQEKIDLILKTAAEFFIDPRFVLTPKTKWVEWNFRGPHESYGLEPTGLLIKNNNATIGSLRLLCEAWPPIVHMRVMDNETLLHLVCDFHRVDSDVMGSAAEKRLEMLDVILSIARKTKDGSRSLVAATSDVSSASEFKTGRDHWSWSDRDSLPRPYTPQTALHLITHSTRGCYGPHLFIKRLVQERPDILKHCVDHTGCCLCVSGAPLHNVCRYLKNDPKHPGEWFDKPSKLVTHEQSILCLLEFCRHSTPDALAFALLQCCSLYQDTGFELLWNVLSDDSSEAYLDLEVERKEILELLISKSDDDGNTILHHAAQLPTEPTTWQMMHEKRKLWNERDIPDSSDSEDEEEEDDYELGRDMTEEERVELRRRLQDLETASKERLKRFFRWFHSFSADSLKVPNKAGLTPLDSLVANGKMWFGDDLPEYITLLPQWPTSRNAQWGLFPFQTAAAAGPRADLTTIYELLQYAPGTIQECLGT